MTLAADPAAPGVLSDALAPLRLPEDLGVELVSHPDAPGGDCARDLTALGRKLAGIWAA